MRSRLESCLHRHSHKHDATGVIMLVRFHGRDYDISHDFENSVKLRDALIQCNILPSTVVVSFNEQNITIIDYYQQRYNAVSHNCIFRRLIFPMTSKREFLPICPRN